MKTRNQEEVMEDRERWILPILFVIAAVFFGVWAISAKVKADRLEEQLLSNNVTLYEITYIEEMPCMKFVHTSTSPLYAYMGLTCDWSQWQKNLDAE